MDVIPYDERGNSGNKTSDDIGGYKLIYPNDLVLNKMNAIIGSLGCHGTMAHLAKYISFYVPESQI